LASGPTFFFSSSRRLLPPWCLLRVASSLAHTWTVVFSRFFPQLRLIPSFLPSAFREPSFFCVDHTHRTSMKLALLCEGFSLGRTTVLISCHFLALRLRTRVAIYVPRRATSKILFSFFFRFGPEFPLFAKRMKCASSRFRALLRTLRSRCALSL